MTEFLGLIVRHKRLSSELPPADLHGEVALVFISYVVVRPNSTIQ